MSTFSSAWKPQVALLSTDAFSSSERLLCAWLEMQFFSRGGFHGFVDAVSKGYGCGDDGGEVSLPANVIDESLDKGRRERCFQIEAVFYSQCDEPDDVERLSVSAFVFYSSLAVVTYARHVDESVDPFEIIDGIRRGCSPEVQFALVPERQKKEVGLEWRHWKPWSNNAEPGGSGGG